MVVLPIARGGAPMPEELLRNVCVYRDRAAECVKLSEVAANPAKSQGYRWLAEAYLIMANVELGQAEQRAQQKRLNPSG
jgi:hypothetical protein